MSETWERVRSVAPILAAVALVLVLAVFVLRRTGLLTDSVVISVPSVSGEAGAPEQRELRITTLLPPDAIPAIFDPDFVSAEEANAFLNVDDLVIGVSLNGDHRAYGTAFLSSREIVNDTVGGTPLMVTW
jgi:hypothetical protein